MIPFNMPKKIINLFVLSFIALAGFSQTGKISGKIEGLLYDENSRRPVIAATVTLMPLNNTTLTDTAGRFSFSVAPGNYNLIFSSVSYKNDTVSVAVSPGLSAQLSRFLQPVQTTLQDVVVTGTRDRVSEAAMNVERKEADLIIQKLGVKEMERKGVATVAEGLTKVTGVSMIGGQQLLIRGLGDRYNNAVLNGLPIPSPNPDMKVIPLDIFPTGIVSSLSIIKSYSSNLYGDFSGGTIDIITKDYPDKPFFKIGVSSGVNTIVTGKDFYTVKKGPATFSGFTRVDRQLPSEVAKEVFYQSKIGSFTNPFKVPFSPVSTVAPPKVGFNISGGDFKRLSHNRVFGYIVNASFKNNYQIYGGIDRLLNANKVELFTNSVTNYRYQTNTSALASLYYKPSLKTTYKYTLLFVNDSQDEVSDIDGINPDLDPGPVFTRLSTNIQNSLLVNQIKGKHTLSDKYSVNWGASYGITKGSMPDRTQISLINTGPVGSINRSFFFNRDIVGNNHKFFGKLKETEPSVKVELEFKNNDAEGKFALKQLKAGLDGRYKDRSFSARQVDVRTTGIRHTVNRFNIDTTLTQGRIMDGIIPNTWAFVETYYPSNHYYDAHLAIVAPYAFGNWSVTSKTDVLAGLRVEFSDQSVFYKQSNDVFDRPLREFNRNQFDFLPFLTLKYKQTDKNNILFSASRSLTRPLFLELAPFRYNQGFNRLSREGNPFLKNSVNYNADLKYEIYPTRGELMALTVFGKYIQNPIEQALIVSADRLTSFFNSKSATLWGAELEIVRNLGSMFNSESSFAKNFGLGLNIAYINSNIKFDGKNVNSIYSIAPTNKNRPMFGASPFLVNMDISYKQQWSSLAFSQATVTYNVYGKRVVFTGTFGSGDVYEMPAGTLDIIINNQVSKRLNVDVSLNNILNPHIQQKQFFGKNGIVINDYQKGIGISLGIGYNFN